LLVFRLPYINILSSRRNDVIHYRCGLVAFFSRIIDQRNIDVPKRTAADAISPIKSGSSIMADQLPAPLPVLPLLNDENLFPSRRDPFSQNLHDMCVPARLRARARVYVCMSRGRFRDRLESSALRTRRGREGEGEGQKLRRLHVAFATL
jgi:hypothetical protein